MIQKQKQDDINAQKSVKKADRPVHKDLKLAEMPGQTLSDDDAKKLGQEAVKALNDLKPPPFVGGIRKETILYSRKEWLEIVKALDDELEKMGSTLYVHPGKFKMTFTFTKEVEAAP